MATQDPIRITKYTNRRLYDATNSRHLTLDQLVELIKDGHDVERDQGWIKGVHNWG